MKYLVKNAADVNESNERSNTALDSAKTDEIKAYLKQIQDFIDSAKQGDIEKIRECLASDININAVNSDGKTALMWASKNGHFEIVKYLIANGANVNATGWYDYTALMVASQYGHLEVVKYLVENGADANQGALSASCYGHFEIVKYLVENGADVNAKDKYGNTALMAASQYGHFEIVKYLVQNGADVNAKGKDGYTALYLAKTDEIKAYLAQTIKLKELQDNFIGSVLENTDFIKGVCDESKQYAE